MSPSGLMFRVEGGKNRYILEITVCTTLSVSYDGSSDAGLEPSGVCCSCPSFAVSL
jgi:hypothetical protein